MVFFELGDFCCSDQGPQGDSHGQIIEDFMEKAHVQKS